MMPIEARLLLFLCALMHRKAHASFLFPYEQPSFQRTTHANRLSLLPLDLLEDATANATDLVPSAVSDFFDGWGDNGNSENKTAFLSRILSSENGASDSDDDDDDDPSLLTKIVGDTLERLTGQRLRGDADNDDVVGHDETATNDGAGFQNMARDFQNILTRGPGSDVNDGQSVEEIVCRVRENTEQGGLEDTASFVEIFDIIHGYGDMVRATFGEFLGDLEFSKVSPTALWYYLEYEDERKNPSWKRRMHRFLPPVKTENLETLNTILNLSRLSYRDTVDEVREGLEGSAYELIYVDLVSEPGQPAHYVAVKRGQLSSSSELSVLMGIRGTKTAADAITDLLCESVDYRGGKSHAFMLNSARYLVEKHTPMLEDLLMQAGKSKIKLTLTGHSLGAGIAAIAGIEFNDNDKFDAKVIGYGSPPSVSRELAEESSFITSVVNDADIVPRLSGVTVVNLLLDIMAFNWLEYAKRDVEHALSELMRRQPTLFTSALTKKISNAIDSLLEAHLASTISGRGDAERLEPELFPPGRCIHFYRDGTTLSGTYVPNDFFSEVDVSRRMIRGERNPCLETIHIRAPAFYFLTLPCSDHLFDSGYKYTLLELMREHVGDRHFSFDE